MALPSPSPSPAVTSIFISDSPSPSPSPSSASSYPITLSFRGHVKLHHIHQHMTFMQIMAVVQKRFATQLNEDDWQQYLQWIHTTNAMVNAGIMTLQEWQKTCTIVIDAMEMNGNDAMVASICTTGASTSDSSPITSPELEAGWTPPTQTQAQASTDTDMNNNIDTFPSLDITSSLLLQMSEQEQETSQHELDTLLDLTEDASTTTSSSVAPVDMTDVVTDSRHILDTFEIIPPTYTSLPGPLVIEQGPSTSTLPLPMALPLPLTLPPANSNINSEAKHIPPASSPSPSPSTSPSPSPSTSPSPSPSTSPSTSTPTSIPVPRSALRGRLSRSTPRSDRHRITDVTRYAKVTHSMLQLRTLVDMYAEEHPDEMKTPVVMERRNGRERRRKISHRVKVLDDTKKMIIGLKRQQQELQQKIAHAQQQQQQQQSLPDLALSRAMYLSICLSALINPDMHPSLISSGIFVYRSHISGILAEFTHHFATYHGYEYESIYEKEKTYDILHEISMPIEWNGMDTTNEITQQYIPILEKARGTELVIPKTEEWWKARYGLVIPFIVHFRHPNGDALYNIYYRQLQCCMVTNHPYIVNVATVSAEVRIPVQT